MKRLILLAVVLAGPALVQATTYYVAITGSDNNSCATTQSATAPKRTIRAGLACLTAGDTLLIGAGTYNEFLPNLIPAGNGSQRTVVKGNAGATWTLYPSAGCGDNDVIRISQSWIEIANFIIDGTHCNYNALRLSSNAVHVLVRDGEIRHGGKGSAADSGNGVFIQHETSTDNVLQNLVVHDNGTPGSTQEHGIYVRAPRTMIERCRIYNNSGYGIHVYSTSLQNHDTIVRYNEVFRNGSRGILLGAGDNQIAHHNIVYENGSIGIESGFSSSKNVQLYFNSIYNNSSWCLYVSGTKSAKIQNNICYKNSNNNVLDLGESSIISHNLLSDPLFVNVNNGDFRLSAGSSAIDAGVGVSITIDRDFAGNLIPQQAGYDIGTYEYFNAAPRPPENLQIINNN